MSSSPEQLAFAIFDEIVDLAPSERKAELDSRCAGSPAVRAIVERMLAEDLNTDRRTDLLPGEGADLIAAEIRSLSGDHVPERIGRYRVIREVGRGGMGVVYEAEQDEPRRRVALKVIRDGFLLPEARRRFRREAQLLGQLQHRGIAHIYEAGSATIGHAEWPFIAMELLEGRPIDVHTKQCGLTIPQRMELLARVCDAVQHAHQKGVIHRDLKPANVLVVEESTTKSTAQGSGTLVDQIGQPKILDFGIARLAEQPDQATMQTSQGQIVGTLAYMSPEQIDGHNEALDTRADVYALGVMLYLLVAERLPFDIARASIAEAARIIRQTDPRPLDNVDSSLRSDLNTIVRKALEKEPARRYESAAALAEDLRRCLRNDPIVARPATAMYQLRKFAQRNRALVAGAFATTIALVGGLIVAVVLLIATTQERNAKEVALQDSNDVTEFFTGMLTAASPEIGRRDMTVREMLDDAAGTIGSRFGGRPELEARIRLTIGETYQSLGDFDLAAQHHTRSLELLADSGPERWRERARSTIALGHAQRLRADYVAAIEAYDAALSQMPDSPEGAVVGASAMLGRGLAVLRLGRLDEARDLLGNAADTLASAGGPHNPDLLAAREGLAHIASLRGEPAAETMYKDLVAAATEAYGADDPRTLLFTGNLAAFYRNQARNKDAIPLLREVHAEMSRVLGPAHRQTLISANNLAQVLGGDGQVPEAMRLIDAAIATSREKYGEQHDSMLFLLFTHSSLLRQAGEIDLAIAEMARCTQLATSLHGPNDEQTYYAECGLRNLYTAAKDFPSAISLGEEIVARTKTAFPDDHPRVYQARYDLARAYFGAGRLAEAQEMCIAARDHADEMWKGAADRLLARVQEAQRAASSPGDEP